MASQYAGPLGNVCLSVERSTAYFTSAEVTSVPSSNLTPWRSRSRSWRHCSPGQAFGEIRHQLVAPCQERI